MADQLQSFFGNWELRTGYLTAAVLGSFYSFMLATYFRFGPYSKYLLSLSLFLYLVIFLFVIYCVITLVAVFVIYAVLKELSWPILINIYKHIWDHLTGVINFVWIGELVAAIMIHPYNYSASIAITMVILLFSGLNFYLSAIIKSYQREIVCE